MIRNGGIVSDARPIDARAERRFVFPNAGYSSNAWLERLEARQRVVEGAEDHSDSGETSCTPIARRNLGRELNKFETRIANTLHRFGLTLIIISIIDNVNDLISDSRHLTKHHWLSWFDGFAPYSLWIGVLLVFAGIVVRDRNWGRSPGSE